MSGHSEDPVAEESKRFFTFFNLSMFLVAITGVEIVIIYVKTFDSTSIIGVLFATSIVKFIGVVWWFMHLRWDKVLNTILFLMGLVIALGTYFAVIYMADSHPVVEKFEVAKIEDAWKAEHSYKANDYVLQGDSYFQAKNDHLSSKSFESKYWKKVNGVPHSISFRITGGADMIEINSQNPENPYFHLSHPDGDEEIVESTIALLATSASTADFRLKVRSEAFWTESQ
jgi:cytochrome c oxidase subunit 4